MTKLLEFILPLNRATRRIGEKKVKAKIHREEKKGKGRRDIEGLIIGRNNKEKEREGEGKGQEEQG